MSLQESLGVLEGFGRDCNRRVSGGVWSEAMAALSPKYPNVVCYDRLKTIRPVGPS